MNFKERYNLNVSEFVEKKNGFDYLSWAFAWAKVKELDEKATYKIYETAEGLPYFASPLGIDVKVGVVFQGVEHIMRLPVLNGANAPLKTENYEVIGKNGKITVKAATSFDVNKTIMRCLVKAIAMHGIGLSLYTGEDITPPKKETKTTTSQKVEKAPEAVITPPENVPQVLREAQNLASDSQVIGLRKRLEANKLPVNSDVNSRLTKLSREEASDYISGRKPLKDLVVVN